MSPPKGLIPGTGYSDRTDTAAPLRGAVQATGIPAWFPTTLMVPKRIDSTSLDRTNWCPNPFFLSQYYLDRDQFYIQGGFTGEQRSGEGGITSQSGGALWRKSPTEIYHVQFGGGHGTSVANEVLMINLMASAPAWEDGSLNLPAGRSSCSDYRTGIDAEIPWGATPGTPPGGPWNNLAYTTRPDGMGSRGYHYDDRPVVGHTNCRMWVDQTRGRMIKPANGPNESGHAPNGPCGQNIDEFDLVSRVWVPPNHNSSTNPNNWSSPYGPPPNIAEFQQVMCGDPATGFGYVSGLGGSGNANFKYVPGTPYTYVQFNAAYGKGTQVVGGAMCIAKQRNRLYQLYCSSQQCNIPDTINVSTNNMLLFAWDISDPSPTAVPIFMSAEQRTIAPPSTVTGWKPYWYWSMVYEPVLDRIIAADPGGAFYTIDPNNGATTLLWLMSRKTVQTYFYGIAGTPTATIGPNGTNGHQSIAVVDGFAGRLHYVDELGGIAFISACRDAGGGDLAAIDGRGTLYGCRTH